MTSQNIFDRAMAIIDSLSPSGGTETSDNVDYKNRTLNILNVLTGELAPYSATADETESGQRVTVAEIRDFDQPVDLDDYLCGTILPYGLAAMLLLSEDPSVASFCNQKYQELIRSIDVGRKQDAEDIHDVYGGFGYEYNGFGRW